MSMSYGQDNAGRDLLRCRVLVATSPNPNLLNHLLFDLVPAHGFHHRQVLEIVMCLEQGVTREELDKNASNTPNIARITPAQVQDDFGCSVMPRGYDR